MYVEKSNNSQEQGFQLNSCFDKSPFDLQHFYQTTNDSYFDSYAHFGIHQEMLKDKKRTQAYMKAIFNNKHIFQNKIVLDIGSGTGVLSIFAAGAKHVYGVQKASIAIHSKKIIQLNNLSDKITIIHDLIQNIELPCKVDIILSQWMGYCLLFESMLDCVILARQKWLNQNGIILPDKASLNLALFEDEAFIKQKINFWNNVYEIDMSCLKNWVISQPIIDIISSLRVTSTSIKIAEFDLNIISKQDVNFSNTYNVIKKSQKNSHINGFVIWFNVQFFIQKKNKIVLSTSPFKQPTHWKQTLFYFEQQIQLHKGAEIKGSIAIKQNKINPRNIDVKFSLHSGDKYNFVKYYRIN